MKNKYLIIIIILWGASLYSLRNYYEEYYRHAEMPPGFTLVTNSVGKYAVKYIDSNYVIDQDYGSSTYGMGRQRAINRAWQQYEFEKETDEMQKTWH
jgi:hypothetical protein